MTADTATPPPNNNTYEPPLFLFKDDSIGPENSPLETTISETNLTLLCLDYLRDLRRTYTPTELWEAEGMDADYLSLAVWSLSRVFVRPGKLRFERARVCRRGGNSHANNGSGDAQVAVLGGGGMGGEEGASFGNDAWYRSIGSDVDGDDGVTSFGFDDVTNTNTSSSDWNTRQDVKNLREGIVSNNGFHWTGNIVIPKMEDMVSEILLCTSSKAASSGHNYNDYEYNDAHLSNSHRYYLLNGLASGGGGSGNSDEAAITALAATLSRSPHNGTHNNVNQSSNSLALNGGPLTFGEIVYAGLHTLNAKTRIEAEKEMVLQNPLFEQFVRAVSTKGFFTDKRKDDKKKNESRSQSPAMAFLNPEEEARRSRIVYEEKYRKVVNKFRSKLAAKAEMQMQNSPPPMPLQQQHPPGMTPSMQYSMQQQASQYFGHNKPLPNPMNHPQHSMPQSIDASMVSMVADRQRRKREVKIERVRAGGRDGYALNQERGRLMQNQLQQQQQQPKQNQQILQQQQKPVQRPPTPQQQQHKNLQQHQQQQHQQVNNHQQQQAASQYQPLHQVHHQPKLSPLRQRPPAPIRSPHPPQRSPKPLSSQRSPQPQPPQQQHKHPQQQQQQQQQTPQPYKTSPIPQKSSPESIKSTVSSQFNFDSHPSPFDRPNTTNTKPPTPPRPTRPSKSPSLSSQPPSLRSYEAEPETEDEELNWHEAEQLNSEGNHLMQQKKFHDALEAYSMALELCPAGPNSHVYFSNRSAAHLSLNDHASSIRDSQNALELNPEYAKAHSRLGLAHFVAGQYEEAVSAYEVALEYEPENEWNRSHYEKAVKKLQKIKSKKKALQEMPFDEETVHTSNNKSNNEESQVNDDSEYQKTLEADQHKDEGNLHMSNKNYEMALEQYTQAIAISPDGTNSHVYYSNRAAAYCYLGQYDAASEDCLTSIEIKPDYEKAHARLGLSLYFLEDFEGAIQAYERSLELDPANSASKSYLGKAKKRLEEKLEAEKGRQEKSFFEQQEELEKAMQEQLFLQSGEQGTDENVDDWV